MTILSREKVFTTSPSLTVHSRKISEEKTILILLEGAMVSISVWLQMECARHSMVRTPLKFGNSQRWQILLPIFSNHTRETTEPLVDQERSKVIDNRYRPNHNSKINFSSPTFAIFCSLNFDSLYFWNHWEFRDAMYLILKVCLVVKWSKQLNGVTALLSSSTPFRKRPFYSIKGPGGILICNRL